MRIAVFCILTPYSCCRRILTFSSNMLASSTWRWRHEGTPKLRYFTTTLHCVSTQKTTDY